MVKRLSQGWKIFIAGSILTIILMGITLSWPYLSYKFFGNHPETYIFFYGTENSYTLEQLREQAPVRSKINIIPIRYPEGISQVSGTEVPIAFFNWTWPPGKKLYTLSAHNKGVGIEQNIKIDIDFTPSLIEFIGINNENRVSIIRGGQGSSRVILEIDELLPNEIQEVNLLAEDIVLPSFDVWSENEGQIKNVFIYDVVIEPDKDYLSNDNSSFLG